MIDLSDFDGAIRVIKKHIDILKNPDEYRVGEPDLDNEDILDWNVFDEVTK